jgi:linoleoyl-CoA desaturase
MQMPKFSASPHTFHTDLKKRINAYFDQTGKSMTGNFGLYLKAAVLGVSFLALYTHLVFLHPPLFLLLLSVFYSDV